MSRTNQGQYHSVGTAPHFEPYGPHVSADPKPLTRMALQEQDARTASTVAVGCVCVQVELRPWPALCDTNC